MRLQREAQPDVALLDILLPKTSGLELFEELREVGREAADHLHHVARQQRNGDQGDDARRVRLFAQAARHRADSRAGGPGARNPPVDEHSRRRAGHASSQANDDAPAVRSDTLVGSSAQMQEVYKAIGRVAPQDVTVLIRGESGTGKELVARAVYQHSARHKGQFLAVNCAAIPDALLESELFGHEKGSFTGADQRRIGKFEQCSGGTLFLDEIGDMSPLVQSKVLRVLQSQQFERVGGNQTISTDVRVIAATNRPLEKMVEDGEFRSDLYYRLSGFTIQLPPLRERRDDLVPLLENYLAHVQPRAATRTCTASLQEAMEVLTELLVAGQRPRAAERAQADAAALGRAGDHSGLSAGSHSPSRGARIADRWKSGIRRRHRFAAICRRAAR